MSVRKSGMNPKFSERNEEGLTTRRGWQLQVLQAATLFVTMRYDLWRLVLLCEDAMFQGMKEMACAHEQPAGQGWMFAFKQSTLH